MLSAFLSVQKIGFSLIFGIQESVNINDKRCNSNVKQTINFNPLQYDTSGMLFGIDTIKSDGTGNNTQSKVSHSIFNNNFIQNELANFCYLNTGVNGANSSFSYVSYSNSIEDYVEEFYSRVAINGSATAGIDLFYGGISNNFDMNLNLNYNQHISSFFYSHYAFVQRYSLVIQNTYDNQLFINNLNPYYIQQIQLYFDDELSYADLVNIFGTHVLTGASYGGIVSILFSLATNDYKFSNSVSAAIANAMTAGINGIASTNFDYETSIAYNTGISLSNIEKDLKVYSIGGNPFIIDSLDDYHNYIDGWSNSLLTNNNCALTQINNILPLWEILPVEYNTNENKEKMIDDFIEYAELNSINFNNFVNRDIKTFTDLTFTYKSENRNQYEEYTIDDDGIAYQDYDIINLEATNFDIKNDFYDNDFRFLEIDIEIDMKEIDDGYQEFYIYNSSGLNGNSIWSKTNYEYGPGFLDNSYRHIFISTGKISLSNFIDSDKRKIYLRYGAHGNGEDDWTNKNLTLTIKFSKC